MIEAGSSLLWPGILGDNTSVVGIDSFGASGRHTELFEHFGFNVADIITKALEIVENYPLDGGRADTTLRPPSLTS